MNPGRQLSVERHVAAVPTAREKTRADDEVIIGVADRIEQTRDLLRSILVIAGDHDDDVTAAATRFVEAAANSVAHPVHAIERDDPGPWPPRRVRRAVRRAVVDHEHYIDDVARCAADDLADLGFLVKGRGDQ